MRTELTLDISKMFHFNACSTGTLIAISHMSIDFRKAKIFDLIDDLEKIINESEYGLYTRMLEFELISRSHFRIEIPRIETIV